jgi:hypothetical protein
LPHARTLRYAEQQAGKQVSNHRRGQTVKALKAIGGGIRNFFILFSFIVNLILVVVVVALVLLIFDIKNNVVTPLITGLHSSFVGLDQATIDWTIPVRDQVPVVLNIPLQTNTVVRLTEAVPLTLSANITLPGVGELNNAIVNLSLPRGTPLAVNLDLMVPVEEMLDIALDVRAVIPVAQTQLHDPINNLRLTFEPIARALYNLPGDWSGAITMVNDIVAGAPVNLLADNPYSQAPWPGYGQTAGVGYTLGALPWPEANIPIETGIVPVGGIPALDEPLRADIHAQGGPADVNDAARANMDALGISPYTYSGAYAQVQGVGHIAVEGLAPIPQPGDGAPASLDGAAPTPMTPVLGSPGVLPTAETLPNLVIPQVTPIGPDGLPLAPTPGAPAPDATPAG